MGNTRVIVIGGGAAGIMAAIAASNHGAEVTILERNPRIGKKILATGNGRCNFTNINTEAAYYNGHNPKFVYSPLSIFDVYDTIEFFENLGIAHKVEDMGKVFPMSDQASSILDVLLYELERQRVKVRCDSYVVGIERLKGHFRINTSKGETIEGDRVIISTGGKAMPSTGSDGNGYKLATNMGHTLRDVFPGLVQIMLEGPFFSHIKGIKFQGTAEILYKDRSLAMDSGEILFTNYGISGPPILQISRKVGELLNEGKSPQLKLTIMDSMSEGELRTFLDKRFQRAGGKTIEFSLVGLINKRLIRVILKEAGIEDPTLPVESLSNRDREGIVGILRDWRFNIRGTRSWPSAQVTAGGINTDEVDQRTMESKIVEGIYFAGEILDIDGQCGGYNLQWAWSSGYIAGYNASL